MEYARDVNARKKRDQVQEARMTARPPFRATLFVEHSRFDAVHPNQITQRRSQLLEASGVFGSETRSEGAVPVIDVKTLDASDKLRLRRDRGVGAGE